MAERLGGPSVPIGNIGLLRHPRKTAFLTSRHTPPQCNDAIRAWLDSLSPSDDCVMVGNIQKLEVDVLQGLLKRRIPAVLVLAEPYPKMWPTYAVEAIGDGLLLVVTIVGLREPAGDAYAMAEWRNKYMIANADSVVVGMCRPGGMLSRLLVAARSVTRLNEFRQT